MKRPGHSVAAAGRLGERAGQAPAVTCTLDVEGMDCSSCAASVEKALRRLGGVRDVHVDVVGGRVTVGYEGAATAPPELARAISAAGYPAKPPPSAAARAAAAAARVSSSAESGWWKRRGRLFLAVASGALWAGSLAADHLMDAAAVADVLALAAMVTAGWTIVPRGVRAALNRALDMNFLMSLAALGALLIGELQEAASALFLFAVAQLLESRSMDRARNAIRALMDLSPAEATVRRDGGEVRVRAEEVVPGDVVVVRPGEKVPVDGEVISGTSWVNQAPITGESLPVAKEPGAEAFAGTVNGDGVLEVRASRLASDTTLARIIHSVEEAQATRAPTQAFVDRFARVYTPVVVVAALLVFVLPPLLGLGAWSDWFYRALVLLVVACPCALVISTPVTVVSALAGAARSGILIKGGLHLENAGRATVVAMDKTGTLTEGRPEVAEVVPLAEVDAARLLGMAAALEARSEHPLARAVLERASQEGVRVEPATDVRAIPGRGVVGRVDGARVVVGSERLFRDETPLRAEVEAALARLRAEGRTAVLVGFAGENGRAPRVLGALGLRDRVRAGASEALRALHAAGIRRVVMLTGDHEAAARVAVRELGSPGVDELRAGLLPEEKVAAVRELRGAADRVLMVGDGVNDAPALAAADVGVAMGSAGSDAALETADVALMADDLSRLSDLVRFARRAEGIIRANIALSLLTKAAFVGLAVFGLATLWMAVLADMGTSLLVILNGLRAMRVRPSAAA